MNDEAVNESLEYCILSYALVAASSSSNSKAWYGGWLLDVQTFGAFTFGASDSKKNAADDIDLTLDGVRFPGDGFSLVGAHRHGTFEFGGSRCHGI